MGQRLGFVFPGQGSQKVGMLGDLESHSVVLQTFSEASAVLGYDLWNLVQNDADDTIGKTHITQPAILTSSVAIWRLWLEQGGGRPEIMAGHSLGEYSALVCCGVLEFSEAVALVQKRGKYMQAAVPEGIGAMAAIIGLEDQLVIDSCATAENQDVVSAVNFNSPGQVVIAGHKAAVARAIENCKAAGAKRALSLPVSAPFHCALMKPAADLFAVDLAKVKLYSPEIPVLQNFGGISSSDVELIRENLLKQIYSRVPWVETIQSFSTLGVEAVFELGPGKVLSGFNRRINPELLTRSINNEQSLQDALV